MQIEQIKEFVDALPLDGAQGKAIKMALSGIAPMLLGKLTEMQKDFSMEELPLGSPELVDLATEMFADAAEAGGRTHAVCMEYKGRRVVVLFAELPAPDALAFAAVAGSDAGLKNSLTP